MRKVLFVLVLISGIALALNSCGGNFSRLGDGGATASLVPPTITIEPQSQVVMAGQAATFSVTASGTAPLSYQWSKNGIAVGGAITSSYTTSATATGDTASSYTVTVTNTIGNVTSNTATLTVNNAILPVPTGLLATGGNAQVLLTWNSSAGATSYNIYRGTTSGGESIWANVPGISWTTFIDFGVTNGTKYFYKIASVNSGGISALSSEVSVIPQTLAPGVPAGLVPTIGNVQATARTEMVGKFTRQAIHMAKLTLAPQISAVLKHTVLVSIKAALALIMVVLQNGCEPLAF
jgi:hypothetical protein